ncbi:MAG: hypothetical protein ACRDQ0_00815 [Pseudonocardia sp.]
MKPTIGRIVRYTLTEQDADAVNLQRLRSDHKGNRAVAGDVYPATIVRVGDSPKPSCNLQVQLDGDDPDEPGTWSWPQRA